MVLGGEPSYAARSGARSDGSTSPYPNLVRIAFN
jgi:hypothetical protein